MKKIKFSYIRKWICNIIYIIIESQQAEINNFCSKTDLLSKWDNRRSIKQKKMLNWRKIGPHHVEICSGSPVIQVIFVLLVSHYLGRFSMFNLGSRDKQNLKNSLWGSKTFQSCFLLFTNLVQNTDFGISIFPVLFLIASILARDP